MKIVLASSEAVPFAKTGGLADVASALSAALARDGHEVTLVLPNHRRQVARAGLDIRPTGHSVSAQIGGKTVTAEVLESTLPGSNVRTLLIDQPEYFDRDGLYVDDKGDGYSDNCERFVFFSRAVMETCRQFGLDPDVLHANDWQTGLIPALLAIECRDESTFAQTASVITIHNMAFQGVFWHWDMLLTGLDWKYFNWRQMEYFNKLNLLKTGIVFADMLTTVSPTYAREIQTPEYGCGLHGVLAARKADLVGILNGVDTEVWNPAVDQFIAQTYDADTVIEGKPACKAALQQKLGLPQNPQAPLFGMISRMTDQKGFDLIAASADGILERDVQLVFLGTGESRYENMLTELARRYPQKVSATIGFNEALAHDIEAGSDIYLMPSQFEPCGLNQMYSLVYGTVPIVRAVGGLADSVIDVADEEHGNGFRFERYDAQELFHQMRRAEELYHDGPRWNQIVQNGMRRDWSWSGSANHYVEVYERALAKRLQPAKAES